MGVVLSNFIYGFFSLFLFSSSALLGNIVHAPNLDIIEKHIENLDENALVVFDVDFTLIVPNDRILAPCGEEYLVGFMKKARSMGHKGEESESRVMLKMEVSLVEDRILSLLEKLKQKNIKVITLTAMSTGQYGVVANAEQWRIEQLASLGIHLDWAFPEIDSLTLEGFDGKSTAPVFKQGVLASARHPKGKVLNAFLKKIQYVPSKVLFIDDRMVFIDSVESEMEKENIKHTSFFYTAATDTSLQLDKELADFQLSYLMHHEEWLNDEEAKSKMTSTQS